MLKKTFVSALMCSWILAPFSANALVSPLGLAIAAPVQLPPSGFTVAGARMSALFGRHQDVYGLDVSALGSMTDRSFAGIAVAGGFNFNKGTATIIGLQLGGLANFNINKARIFGLQLTAGVNNNVVESTVVGLQVGMANLSAHTGVYGMQVGVFNKARDVYGFQIGLVNVTHALHGVQIGLLNFNQTGLFSIAPLLNIGF